MVEGVSWEMWGVVRRAGVRDLIRTIQYVFSEKPHVLGHVGIAVSRALWWVVASVDLCG